MKVTFLGVGEAFDDNLPNNSHIIESGNANILLDCGFNVPQQLWKFNPDPSFLDAIYISHQHADHYFGLPAVLLRMWESGREKKLTIFCQQDLRDSFWEIMDLAYKGFVKQFEYKMDLVVVEAGAVLEFQGLKMSFDKTVHSQNDLAIKITDGRSSIAYSGDGSPIAGTDFYKNLDLMILEAYLYDTEKIGHSSIVSAIKFAEDNDVKCLAITHINRDFRKKELPKIRGKIKSNKIRIIIPEPLDTYDL